MTYTITNSGTDALSVTTPTVAGNISGASNVTVNSLTLGATSVAAGGSTTTLVVSYTPTVAGAFGFDLSLANGDGDENPYNITASGTATGAPEIAISSSEGGAVADGGTDTHGTETAEAAKNVFYTITNSGLAPLNLTAPTVQSNISNLTNVTVNAIGLQATTLAPGASTVLTVNYTPTTGGAFSFDLSLVNDDADENPYNITVSGNATGTPVVQVTSTESGTINPENGSDDQGQEPAAQPKVLTYRITNNGTDVLVIVLPNVGNNISNLDNVTVNQINITLLSSARAARTMARAANSGTSVSIPVGGSANLNVEYTPSAPGPFSFDVNLQNATTSSDAFALDVMGVAVALPEIAVTSSEGGAVADGGTDTFSSSPVAGSAGTVTYTINNTGTTALSVTTPTVASNISNTSNVTVNSLALGATSVAAGGSTTLTVNYTPTVADQAFSFDLSLANNDADENPYNITASGRTQDTVEPQVTLSGPAQAVGGDFTLTISASEDISGLALGDFMLTNGTASNLSGSGSSYSMTVSPTTFGQTVSVTLPAGAVQDLAGNLTTAASTFSVLAGSPETEFARQLNDIIDTVQLQARQQLDNEMSANREMTKKALDRFILSFKNGDAATRAIPLDLTGTAELTPTRLATQGTLFGQALIGEGTMGQFDLTRDAGGTTTGQVSGRVTWERNVSETTRLGYFVGASLGRSNINGVFDGDGSSIGAIVGGYGLTRLGEAVFATGYAGLGYTLTDLSVSNATLTLDGDYGAVSYYAGAEVTGSMDVGNGIEFRPSLALDYGRTSIGVVGFDASAFGLTSQISSDMGAVSILEISLTPEFIIPLRNNLGGTMPELSISPRAVCRRTTGRVDNEECGGGLSIALDGRSADGLGRYGVKLDYQNTGSTEQSSANIFFEQQF